MSKTKPQLILASQSAARQSLLKNAGLVFKAVPAQLDEDAFHRKHIPTRDIALELAKAKALSVAQTHKDALVIGADQILEFEGALVTKAASKKEAREKLGAFRGKTHKLISAVSVVKAGTILWSVSDEAQLSMHNLSDDVLDLYCEKAGDALTACVGSYALEERGSWLFSAVKGDYFTVLGLPLLPLLAYLREYHGVTP
ncbi:MAG: septum formation protein Maf [Alphaproteobacteria bacterium]|nr:septum formation protein Maf [Alphaproteobacteria bacterium]